MHEHLWAGPPSVLNMLPSSQQRTDNDKPAVIKQSVLQTDSLVSSSQFETVNLLNSYAHCSSTTYKRRTSFQLDLAMINDAQPNFKGLFSKV